MQRGKMISALWALKLIMDINKLSSIVIGAAIEVHKALGPGLLEFHPVKFHSLMLLEFYHIYDGKI